MQHRSLARFVASAALGMGLLVSAPGTAHAEQRTWNRITTGNGHGFQVYDAEKNKITVFLEHPYRYLRAIPDDDTREGPGRRNLAFDFFFGLKGKGWLSTPDASEAPEYLDQTNILRAPATMGGTKAESFFFAPFGLERNVMIGLLHAPGVQDAAALFNFHMGTGGTDPGANGESTKASTTPGAIIETGPGGGAMVYVSLTGADHLDCDGPFGKINGGLGDGVAKAGDDIACGIQGKLQNDWLAVAVGFTGDAAGAEGLITDIKTWTANRAPDKILSDVKAEFEAWRKPAPAGTALCSDDEKKLYRMSETTLRMGQVREPNIAGRQNYGMILASLPIGEWHTGWVRDAQYAIVALARMGHHAEAKMALDFLLNARPINKYKRFLKNKVDYRISVVRYFGSGEEEADFNQDGPNIELDGWGMVMWAARQYVDASGDTAWLSSPTFSGSVYDALKGGVADALEANLESNGIVVAESGPWEVHTNGKERHYAYTTLAAARGFCDMATLAQKGGRGGDVGKYQGLAKRVKTAFFGTFVDPQGALAGSTEGLQNGKYQDGAVAEAFTWNILTDWKGDTARATLDLFEKLRVQSGGYKRNNDGLSSYDNNEWILVDLRIADSLRRAGKGDVADGIIATIVQKAATNFYLLPELYNDTPQDGQIGRYTGSIPMVGYGGGAYVLTVLDRSGLIEPHDCGDGVSVTLPKLECTSISTQPGGGPGGPSDGDGGTGSGAGGAPDGSQVPFVNACLCRLGMDSSIPPFGIAFFLALPLVLGLRRQKRR